MRSTKYVPLIALVGQVLHAQTPPVGAGLGPGPAAVELTVEEAIATARQNNPAYLQTVNTRRTAEAQVRSAYGALLPSSTASFGARYQQGGQQVIQGLSFSSNSDAVQSVYNLGLNYNVNSGTFLAPRAARANRDAADATITSAGAGLRDNVVTQYLTVLEAQARAALQDTLVVTAEGQLALAAAKRAAGAATVLDTRTAEVALGQAQVAALTAHNTAAVELLRLYQLLGVPEPAQVVLTTTFPVGAAPPLGLDSLLALARRTNPAVVALAATERATQVSLRVAETAYTPSLYVGTGWSGNAYQYTDPNFLIGAAQSRIGSQAAACYAQDSVRTRVNLPSIAGQCAGFVFTPGMAQQIRNQNAVFPFRFTKAPLSVTAQLSLPVFDNFTRELNVEQAAIARDNARYTVRARALQLTGDVTQAYLTLVTAAKTVALQEQTAAKAREQLAFAEERYRVGAATFLDVTTSRGTFAQAQLDRVNSIYDYHKAFAALESAVGRPLR